LSEKKKEESMKEMNLKMLKIKLLLIGLFIGVGYMADAKIDISNIVQVSNGCDGSFELVITKEEAYELAAPFEVVILLNLEEEIYKGTLKTAPFRLPMTALCAGEYLVRVSNNYGCTFEFPVSLNQGCKALPKIGGFRLECVNKGVKGHYTNMSFTVEEGAYPDKFELYKVSNGTKLQTTTTPFFGNLPNGQYKVIASKEGYCSFVSHRIDIEGECECEEIKISGVWAIAASNCNSDNGKLFTDFLTVEGGKTPYIEQYWRNENGEEITLSPEDY
jgi:hypothetical protein